MKKILVTILLSMMLIPAFSQVGISKVGDFIKFTGLTKDNSSYVMPSGTLYLAQLDQIVVQGTTIYFGNSDWVSDIVKVTFASISDKHGTSNADALVQWYLDNEYINTGGVGKEVDPIYVADTVRLAYLDKVNNFSDTLVVPVVNFTTQLLKNGVPISSETGIEVDPVFSASVAGKINSSDTTRWNTMDILSTNLNVDSSFTGTVEQYISGDTLGFGDWVYCSGNGKIQKSDASSVETAFCIGVVVENANPEDSCYVLTHGTVRLDSWTWVTGGAQKIYLGETPGDAVQYVPIEDGSVVQLLGRPVTENILKVEINEVQAADELAWYGVTVDHNYSSPDLTRIAASEDYMTLHASLPVHSLIRSCLLNDDGTVNYYLDSDTKLLKEDGVTASVLDGTDGQVMVEFPTYYRNVTLEKDGQFFPKISLQPIPGFQRVEKFYISAYQVTINRSGTTGTSGTAKFHSIKNTAPEYRGGNNQSEWDSDSRSLLGKPASYLRLDFSRRYARNRGDGWEVLPYRQSMLLYELYMIEYATLNSQKPVVSELTIDGYRQGGLGNGVTTTTGTIWNAFNSYYPFVHCGVADTLGNGSGEVTYVAADFNGAGNDITFKVAVYHGVENIFGHLFEWVDGANAFFEGAGGVGKLYLADARTKFADNTSVGYTLGSHIPTTDGYIKKMVFDREGILIPAETGGGLDTYYCDYMYQPGLVNEWRSLRRGGYAYLGTSAGFACVSANNAFSSARADYGARLCFLTGNK